MDGMAIISFRPHFLRPEPDRRAGRPDSPTATAGHRFLYPIGKNGITGPKVACQSSVTEYDCTQRLLTLPLHVRSFSPTATIKFTPVPVPLLKLRRGSTIQMAKIFPFRALRYDSQKIPMVDVVTQPYDKISPSMQDRYYTASPYNLVRVILGKSEPGDGEQSNVYTRAAANLRNWCAESVLVRDPEPSIYRYTQTFRVPGDSSGTLYERRGFIATGQLEDYDHQVVFRHEQTLSKPKADRLNLLRETQSHFGQIFMLYSDPAQTLDTALVKDRPPDVEVRDEY